MKFYKVVNSKKGHHGLFYKEGRNIDPLDFNPKGNCETGGIYFSREDIFAFFCYGDEVYEVIPISEIYENPGSPKKWKAKEVDFKYIGKTNELKTIKHLVEDGANIESNDYLILRVSSIEGQLDIIKYFIEQGIDIHLNNDMMLENSSVNGHLDIIKYLIEQGANIHVDDDYPLRRASYKGYLETVKYLVEQGADISARSEEALFNASNYGYLKILKYLIEQGADIRVLDINIFKKNSAIFNFLKSCM